MFFAGLAVAAAEPNRTTAFLAPGEPLAAGSEASLWLYTINNTNEATAQPLSTNLLCRLVCGSNTVATVLTLNSKQEALTDSTLPGVLVKTEYQLQLPQDLSGIVALEISNYNSVTLIIRPRITRRRRVNRNNLVNDSPGLASGFQSGKCGGKNQRLRADG